MNETIHPKEDFQNLNLNELKKDDWSFGRGGYGLSQEIWTIWVFKNDGCDIWVLPDALQFMLNTIKKTGGDDMKQKFSDAIVNILNLAGLGESYGLLE